MDKKKYSLLFGCFLATLLVAGCTNDENTTSRSDNEDANTISKLEQTLQDQQETIVDHENKLTALGEWEQVMNELSLLKESSYYLQNRLDLQEAVINETTNYKTAILNSFDINEESFDINITYKNKVIDEDAPNGYRLFESGEGTKEISIKKDVPIWMLENPGESVQVTWEEFAPMSGFLKLYEKDGEVVFISEIYLP
ncbi:hypothetical protein [Solibacillus merdavium]|uniref:Lipoprotein n=1 Tax=Solibacillus merdavium TaxID=2762218 RepID=A0ABR8XNI4_9BACL|nr:hypothetical protein [Solibacillus merdavium]MBD8033493.1 hypothetical protein [Solibacillus merdavium]